MSKPRTIVGTLWLAVLVVAGTAATLHAGALALGWYAYSITDTPTCVEYIAEASPGSPAITPDAIGTLLADSGLREIVAKHEFNRWEDAKTSVLLYESGSDSTIFVCAKVKRSVDYQNVAKRIEAGLYPIKSAVRASINRDVSVYRCNPNCSINSVDVPVDFANLNASLLAFPKDE